jgi:hypothetical protein
MTRVVEYLVIRVPAELRASNVQPNSALLSEFQSVREQVLQHLLQALIVGRHYLRKGIIEIDVELNILALRPRGGTCGRRTRGHR